MSKSKPTNEESSRVAKMVGEEIRAGRNPEDTLYVLSTGNFKVIRIDGSSDDDYSRRWEIVKVSSFPTKPPKKHFVLWDDVNSSSRDLTPASCIMLAAGEMNAKTVRPNQPKGFKFPDETDFSLTDFENSPLSMALERTRLPYKRNNDRDFLGAIIFPPNIQKQ